MKHIVLIDDDLFIRDLVATKLSESYSIIAAGSAAEGLEALAKRQTDLLLLDMDLPDRHGLELLEEIKADPSTANVPTIVFSNNDDPDLKAKTEAAGAMGFIVKVSMDMSELKDRIDGLLNAA